MRYLFLTSACLFATLPSATAALPLGEGLVDLPTPTLKDTDGDGLDDATEKQLGLNPADPADGLADLDKDDLSFAEEWKAGTNPNKADTDGDGIDDLNEILRGTDPTDPNDPPRLTATVTPSPRATAARRAPLNLLLNGDFGLPLGLGRTAGAGNGYFGGAFRWDYLAAGKVAGWSAYTGTHIEVWSAQGNQFIELDASKGHFGIKQRIATLQAGGYVLHWKQCGRGSPQAGKNAYWVAVTDSAGKTIARTDIPSQTSTGWSDATLTFSLSAEQAQAGITLNFVPVANTTYGCLIDQVSLVTGMLEVDADRDGRISTGEKPANGRNWRHWINDDQDETDCEGDDIDVPGRSSSRANWQMDGINGQRDLVDYFAVNLAISEVVRLLPPAEGYRYSLRQADRAVNFAFTSLRPAEANLHHETPVLHRFRGADGEATKDVLNAWVHRLSDTGEMPIDEAWLARIEQVGHGLILVEGARATQKPLELVVSKNGKTTLTLSLPLEIVPVESMYRSVDLTGVCRDYEGQPVAAPEKARPTDTSNPKGLPDAELGDSWTVFLHGYNVNAQRARGWHAEVFKRLYVMGSRTRFVGVTWYGDTGVRVAGTSLDYHGAVFNALQTGDQLRNALGFLDPANTTVMAHSLGNMVACQAIQKGGLTPRRYLMLNAAVPTEAFAEVSDSEAGNMVEKDWRGKEGTYTPEYFTANWYKKFPETDLRSKLKWSDLFSRMRTGGFTINCYSKGDDIVRCPEEIDSISLVQQIWEGGFAAWKSQELLKGLRWSESLGSLGMARDQAGWSRKRFGPVDQPDPAYNPYFREFLEPGMTSQDAATVQALLGRPLVIYDLFARAIPALSYGAGAQPIPGFNNKAASLRDESDPTNYDFEAKGRVGADAPFWPTVNHGNQNDPDDERKGRWLHSDFRNAALPFVSPAFKYFVTQTN
jgi:hypothetical protein